MPPECIVCYTMTQEIIGDLHNLSNYPNNEHHFIRVTDCSIRYLDNIKLSSKSDPLSSLSIKSCD